MAVVLVVDDDPDIRDLLAAKLTSTGHRVLTAVDGAEGVAAAKTHLPDLAVVDVMMPKLDGFGVLRQIRACDDLRRMPLILISADGQAHRVDAGLAAGADDFIRKPFALSDLASRVTVLLDGVGLSQPRHSTG